MDQLMVGFMTIMEPLNFLSVFVGVLGGMIIGAMPGLTAPMGVALLIPFTYGMMPVPAITMLVSLYCGATFGGSIAAILVHAPGTPAAAATTFDGYPLAQKGQAGKALGMACISSGLGGLFSGWMYGVWPVGRPWLGLHTGVWVTGPVLVSLAAQIVGAMLCIRRTPREAGPRPEGRFTRTYLPPIEKR